MSTVLIFYFLVFSLKTMLDNTNSENIREYICPVSGVRLDVFLSEVSGFTRSRIKQLIENGHVLIRKDGQDPDTDNNSTLHTPHSTLRAPRATLHTPHSTLNNSALKCGTALKAGDRVILQVPAARPLSLLPEDIEIGIVYEDEYLAVVDKPQGLTVHPGSGQSGGTLVNALLAKLNTLSGINGAVRPGIVHRLDKHTSGLLVIAKTDAAHLDLSKQIAEKSAVRIYHALLEGLVKDDCGTVDKPVGRDTKDRKKMAVTEKGRHAVTHYRVLKRFAHNNSTLHTPHSTLHTPRSGYTYAEFKLETGRTHQIRVHAKSIGHPVVGDTVYGYKTQKFKLNGQLLHAKELSFVHPVTRQKMTFKSDLPAYFADILKRIK